MVRCAARILNLNFRPTLLLLLPFIRLLLIHVLTNYVIRSCKTVAILIHSVARHINDMEKVVHGKGKADYHCSDSYIGRGTASSYFW
jgi:hypothetical protein